jgi:hypothetical protein
MADLDEVWIPLVDEPIGSLVTALLDEDPELQRLVGTPRRLLAFRTFAYVRAGIVLGRLLIEHDAEPGDVSGSWVDELLDDPGFRAEVMREIRAVADEIAADPRYAEDETVGPDEEARLRFRAFARERLGARD